MADLDDFFAKKDRKKKTTKKFATTEEVAKKLEDTAKKTEKQKKERIIPEGEESSAPQQEQDEWKEFEEEKKDYTGLKIGNLTINPNQENNSVNQEPGSGDQAEGGEMGQDQDRKAGPWRRVDGQAESAQEEPPRPVQVEKKPEPAAPVAAAAPGSYRPPSMRNMSSQPAGGGPPSRLRGNRGAAPDIHNEDFFPTLSKSGENKKTRGEGTFEVVQQHRASSYRQQMEQSKSSGGPRLNLGNRFNTLSNDS